MSNPRYSVIIEGSASRLQVRATSEEGRGTVRGGEAVFDPAAARAITRDYAELLEHAHRLRRSCEHTLTGLSERLRREVLTGEALLAFDDAFAAGISVVRVQGPPDLLNLPWEALHHQGHGLATFHKVPFVRNAPTPLRAGSPEEAYRRDRLRVLLVPAQPHGQPPVHWRDTRFELDAQLWHLDRLGLVEWHVLGEPGEPNTLARLRDVMSRTADPFHVVVFLAHGRGDPAGIALVGPRGETVWHDVRAVIPALTVSGALPRLVVLGCCHLARVEHGPGNSFGGFAYDLVNQGVASVLSMQSAVTTRGAALAIAAVLKGLLGNDPLGLLLWRCRHEMRDALREAEGEAEATLPVLWLNDDMRPTRLPLLQIEPPDCRHLLDELERYFATGNLDLKMSEWMVAAAQFVREAGVDSDQKLRRLYERKRLDHATRRVGESRAAGSAERAAEEILAVRRMSLADSDPALAEAVAWIKQPLQERITAAKAHLGDRNWPQAVSVLTDGVRLLEAAGDHVRRLWTEELLSDRLHDNLAFAHGMGALDEAERWRRLGDTAQACDWKQEGLRLLEPLACGAGEFAGHLDEPLQKWRRELSAERLAEKVRGDVARQGQGFSWQGAYEELAQARGQWAAAVTEAELEEAAEGARLEAMLSAALAEAGAGRWAEACQVVGAALPLRHDGARLRQWWESRRLEERLPGWRAAARAHDALIRLRCEVAVPVTLTDRPLLREALRFAPTDPARLDAVADLAADSPAALMDHLAERLGPDAALGFALAGDWEGASDAYGALVSRGGDHAAACHRLCVAGLAQAKAAEALAAWAGVAAEPDYWPAWLRRQTGAEPSAAQVGELTGDLRDELVAWLAGCADPARQLAAARQSALLPPGESFELVLLGLDVAERAAAADDWGRLRSVWRACLALADDAERVPATCARILRTADAHAARLALDGGRLVALLGVVYEVLERTDRRLAVAGRLAVALLQAGLDHLRRQAPDSLALAYQAFERAYDLRADDCTTAAFAFCLAVQARQGGAEDEQQRLYEVAATLVREGRERWPRSALLLLLEERLRTAAGLSDPRVGRFWEQVVRWSGEGAAGAGLVDLARLALHNGDAEDAALFLKAALADGLPVPRDLAGDVCERYLRGAVFAGGVRDDADRARQVGDELLGLALAAFPDDERLLAWRRAMAALQEFL